MPKERFFGHNQSCLEKWKDSPFYSPLEYMSLNKISQKSTEHIIFCGLWLL